MELTEEQVEIIKKIQFLHKEIADIHLTNSNDFVIKFNLNEKSKTAKLVILIHKTLNIVLIWNIEYRRTKGWTGKSISYNKAWKDLLCRKEYVFPIYKTFLSNKEKVYEKVLLMSLDTLNEASNCLFDLLDFDMEDNDYPKSKKLSLKNNLLDRKRITTSRWNRDKDFRYKVLEAYGYKCAICRCDEEKILQAAHIKAVSEKGNDDIENGICLCANHHIMMDKGLIKIDFDKLKLEAINNSVKKMAWYEEFVKKYKGEIISARIKKV